MGDIGVWVKLFEACIVSLVFFSSIQKVIWNHRKNQGEPENKTGFVFTEGHRGWVQTWHTRRSVSSKSSGFISCIHPAKSPSTPCLNQTKDKWLNYLEITFKRTNQIRRGSAPGGENFAEASQEWSGTTKGKKELLGCFLFVLFDNLRKGSPAVTGLLLYWSINV